MIKHIRDFISSLILTRRVDKNLDRKINTDRRRTFAVFYKPSEILPIEIWTYLVKLRAGFACEDCGDKNYLISHHIRRRDGREGHEQEDKEKNILSNGRCVCSKCHPNYLGISKRGGTYQKFIECFGYIEGNALFEEYRNIRSKKEESDFVNRIFANYDSDTVIKWSLGGESIFSGILPKEQIIEITKESFRKIGKLDIK